MTSAGRHIMFTVRLRVTWSQSYLHQHTLLLSTYVRGFRITRCASTEGCALQPGRLPHSQIRTRVTMNSRSAKQRGHLPVTQCAWRTACHLRPAFLTPAFMWQPKQRLALLLVVPCQRLTCSLNACLLQGMLADLANMLVACGLDLPRGTLPPIEYHSSANFVGEQSALCKAGQFLHVASAGQAYCSAARSRT